MMQLKRSMWLGLSWRRWALRGVLVLAALGLVTFTALHYWADRKLASVLAEVAAQGISLEPRDYLATLNRDEPNGSHALGAVCHLLASLPPDAERTRWRELSLVKAVRDPAIVEEGKAWLERPVHRLVLEILDLHIETRRANAVQGGASEQAQAAGQYVSERAIPVLALPPLLRLRAWTEMAAGDSGNSNSDAAYDAAAALLRVANWIYMESPSVLSWMIGNALADSGLKTMEELQQIDQPSAEARRRLRAELLLFEGRGVSLGLEADLAMTYQQMLRGVLWSQADMSSSMSRGMTRAFQSWTETAFHAQWLLGYSELIRRARIPAHQRPSLDSFLEDDSPFMIPVKFLVPNLADSMHKTDAVSMRRQLALLALAWEDYWDQQGVYPSAGGDLVPHFLDALPKDHFSGGELQWQRQGDGWLVYSIGVDRQDSGGVDRQTPQSGDEDDIGWRLPGPTTSR